MFDCAVDILIVGSCGYALVDRPTPQVALHAVAMLNGKPFRGNRLIVKHIRILQSPRGSGDIPKA
jgi:RNA recognition motif-containing protein